MLNQIGLLKRRVHYVLKDVIFDNMLKENKIEILQTINEIDEHVDSGFAELNAKCLIYEKLLDPVLDYINDTEIEIEELTLLTRSLIEILFNPCIEDEERIHVFNFCDNIDDYFGIEDFHSSWGETPEAFKKGLEAYSTSVKQYITWYQTNLPQSNNLITYQEKIVLDKEYDVEQDEEREFNLKEANAACGTEGLSTCIAIVAIIYPSQKDKQNNGKPIVFVSHSSGLDENLVEAFCEKYQDKQVDCYLIGGLPLSLPYYLDAMNICQKFENITLQDIAACLPVNGSMNCKVSITENGKPEMAVSVAVDDLELYYAINQENSETSHSDYESSSYYDSSSDETQNKSSESSDSRNYGSFFASYDNDDQTRNDKKRSRSDDDEAPVIKKMRGESPTGMS